MVAFLGFVEEQFCRVCRGTAFRVSFVKLATNRVSEGRKDAGENQSWTFGADAADFGGKGN